MQSEKMTAEESKELTDKLENALAEPINTRVQRRMTAKKARKQFNKHVENYSVHGARTRQAAFGQIGTCSVYTEAQRAKDEKKKAY